MNDALSCGHVGCGPCSEHERAIRRDEQRLIERRDGKVDAEAAAVGARVLAWIKAGGHIEVQRGIKDDRTRREFGRLVHAWTQGEVK